MKKLAKAMTPKVFLHRLAQAANSAQPHLLNLTTAILLLAITYFIAAKLGLELAYIHRSATAVWPPAGVALGALILFGQRLWPGVFIGAFLANITATGSVWTPLGIATGNTLEAVLATYLVNHFAGGRHAFDRPQDVFKFATLAGVVSTAVSASFGVTSLCLGGVADWSDYPGIWLTWWLGDMGGALILAPLLIVWGSNPRFVQHGRDLWERCVALALLVAVGYFAFASFSPYSYKIYAIGLLSIPILLWTALRFDRREAAAAVFLMYLLAVWGTVKGYGPFYRQVPNESLLLLQEFWGMTAVIILMLSAATFSRRRTEEALRESETRKTAMFRTALDCIISIDHAGKIIEFNPAAERTFGYCREDVLGQKMAELIIPLSLRDRHRRGMTDYLVTGEGPILNQRIEMLAVRASGQEFPVELTVTRTPTDGPPLFTAYLRDIADRKRAEQHLMTQYAVSRALAESATLAEAASKILRTTCERLGWQVGGLWYVDQHEHVLRCLEVYHLPAVQIPRFDAVSRQRTFERGIGLPGRVWSSGKAAWIPDVVKDDKFPRAPIASAEGLHGAFGFPVMLNGEVLGVIEFFSDEIRQPDEDLLQMMTAIGNQIGQFIERRRAEELLAQAKNELLKANEELERRVHKRTADLQQAHAALLTRMEEQRRLEEQLHQAQKMESIGTLAGGIAHDFNNILNIIEGYACLIERGAENQDLAESVKVIKDSVKRGAAVVQQLLTFARKAEKRHESAEVNAVVCGLANLLKETFPRTIEIRLELDAGLPPAIADPNHITQALLNLSVNARDAMPNGGKLTFRTAVADRTSLRKFSAAKDGPYVCIEVADTGAGMDESTLSRIFDPFFTTKEPGKGTGLGLAVVYGLVEGHHGFIDVASEPMKGTTFKIFVPSGRTSIKEAPLEKTPAESLDGKRGTILIVEDEKYTVRLLNAALKKSGLQTLSALDGLTAVEMFKSHREEIDVVLLDLGIPKLHGKEVLQKIKSENPDARVIVASGYLEPEVKLDLTQLGVRVFVNKPYSIEEIRCALSLALQESSQTDSSNAAI